MQYHSYERHADYIVKMLEEGQDETYYNHINHGVCQVGGMHKNGELSFLRDLTDKELEYLSTYMGAYFGTPTTNVLEIEELLTTERPEQAFAWRALEFYLPSRIYVLSLSGGVTLVLDETQSKRFINKHEATDYFEKLTNIRNVVVRDSQFNLLDTFSITIDGEDIDEEEIDEHMNNVYKAFKM